MPERLDHRDLLEPAPEETEQEALSRQLRIQNSVYYAVHKEDIDRIAADRRRELEQSGILQDEDVISIPYGE